MSEQTDSSFEVFPTWLSQMYSDNEYEAADNTPGELLLIPPSGRFVVWKLVRNILGDDQVYVGIGGQSCQVLERYFKAYVSQFLHFPSDSTEWLQMKWGLYNKIQLLAAVCIQLVVKMESRQTYVSMEATQKALEIELKHYTLEEIKNAENEVYKGIGYRLQLWTNVDKALLMANEVGMVGECIMKGVSLVMDIVDYGRPLMQEQLDSIFFNRNMSNKEDNGPDLTTPRPGVYTGYILNMHLAASAVVATAKFFNIDSCEPIQKLSCWTRSPECYIECLSNIIVKEILLPGIRKLEWDNAARNSFNLPQVKRRRLFCFR